MLINDLLSQIESYLSGHQTLQGLEQWLLLNLQTILDSGDQQAIALANAVDALLVDAGEGLTTCEEMVAQLEALARQNPLTDERRPQMDIHPLV